MDKDTIELVLAAAESYVATLDDDEMGYEDFEAETQLIDAFGIQEIGDDAHRCATWLCVLASQKVLYGWAALECESDLPSQTIEAVSKWVQEGIQPRDWQLLTTPAQARRKGRVIMDCDTCRAEPIASAAAQTARFARTAASKDAAEVLCDVFSAISEGVYWSERDPMDFQKWVGTVAIPAALELRRLSEAELYS
ncbi:hypothetical protein [Armatimonas sp.]|uniref:hypothetical protein n=1 Tax=Armatimonas sp. TaxID=1872638 RepID=UPI00286BF4F1|nr:hypothetical protein [Armatimonas sp.]